MLLALCFSMCLIHDFSPFCIYSNLKTAHSAAICMYKLNMSMVYAIYFLYSPNCNSNLAEDSF